MNFGSRDDERHVRARRHVKPPPNYFSRSTQMRLITMVFAFMLVIVLMYEASKPENWKWMWAGVENIETSTEEGGPIDTRLPPDEPKQPDPVGTIYANKPAGSDVAAKLPVSADHADAVRRIQLDAWRGILKRLDRDQRVVLQRVLRSARRKTEFDRSNILLWSDTLAQLEKQLKSYLQTANEAVLLAGQEVPDAQKQRLMNALRTVEIDWKEMLGPSLQAAAEERAWTEPQRESLAKLQQTLDTLAMDEIKDDMVISRSAEQHAWFRLFERLIEQDEQSLEQQSLGEASFVQLFRQTDEYRGKLVTVRGRTELVYRVMAPKNDLDIEEYFIFWLYPRDSSNSPIVVYMLDLPPDFPEVGTDHTPLRENISFTGYFFKRWAYSAKDGIRTAPLLLAKAPQWQPEAQTPIAQLPSPGVAFLFVVVIAWFAFTLARLAYRTSGAWSAQDRGLALRTPKPEQFKTLASEQPPPSIGDALKELADQDER